MEELQNYVDRTYGRGNIKLNNIIFKINIQNLQV